MSWLFLLGAIATEITATLALRASDGLRRKRWIPLVLGGYAACFVLLSFSMRHGMPVGVAYGIWAAIGVAATAVLARLLFRDPLTRRMGAGIALIAAGVLLVELGAHAA